ncbi:glycosyl transferase [Mannheimia varigena]|uniref:CDP-glycerol glycerophosphotransferase family protein n=1 Tax=Mannheimia varigena TaxID=85404 RepID=UPI000DBF30CD|nr:CDP-glycerol glycerophosphotransferase family protein [Mannheimia varigena]AWW34029.1 glycosyl transferase [Mannheimia varigena]
MSNITSRVKQILLEPKVTLKKVKHKFKQNPNDAWGMILSDVKGDTKNLYHNVRKRMPIKYKGKNNFTIVSACYNVEKYLDEYFKSIVSQSLDFKKHIQIICVDDGSTDNTAEIIKKWKVRYPNNIHYYYKENGGQASARNLGLSYVDTEWVTFIDPDDFISANYFYELDKFILTNNNLLIIGTPMIFYFEDKKLYKDTHPLKYRFDKGNEVLKLNDLKNSLQLSASTAIFKTDYIKRFDIKFDDKLKPSFEDAKFTTDYILENSENGDIGFIHNISYFYRKRSDGSSSLDGAWKNPKLFSTVISDGCIAILKDAKEKFGYVPEHIQRVALYHISWYFGKILNNEESLSHLNSEQKEVFKNNLKEMFNYIDVLTIKRFNLAGIWLMHKVGMIGLFKNEDFNKNIVYIENVNRNKKEVLLSYYVHFDKFEDIRINDCPILPISRKSVKYNLLDSTFVIENRCWVRVGEGGTLTISINGNSADFSLSGELYKEIKINDILKVFTIPEKYKSDGSWIFMDRNVQADDNAEHLYRYILKSYPEKNIYFALDRSSHDWDRLERDGFNLVDYGSKEFEKALNKSEKVISSHLDKYIYDYYGDSYGLSKDFIFLQHGITKDNLSLWFNTKKYLTTIITATVDEFKSIAYGDSYKAGKKNVALTGFPRHDALLEGNLLSTKEVLIMPTWRSYIVGNIITGGFEREKNKFFTETLYYKHWSEFLASPELEYLVKESGFKVTFAPHANIEPYLDEFSIPDYINVWKAKDGKIQDLFRNAKFMITDYSSVAFEMAFLGKQVLYYQFDKELVFGGEHTYQKGYFSYEDHGFGPVVENLEDLLISLKDILEKEGEPVELYKQRIENTFPFRDGNNCERVYQAIKALNEPETKEIDLDVLREAVQSAYKNKAWALLLSRCELLEKYGDESDQSLVKQLKPQALIGAYQFEEFEKISLEHIDHQQLLSLKAKQLFIQQKWLAAANNFEALNTLSDDEAMMLVQCYAELNQTGKLVALQEKLEVDEDRKVLLDCWLAISEERWYDAIALLEPKVEELGISLLKRDKPQLLLARAYRVVGDYTKAHEQLVAYEKHTAGDTDCRLEIAHLAFVQNNNDKVVTQLNRTAFKDVLDLPVVPLTEYIISTEKLGNSSQSMKLLVKVSERYKSDETLMSVVSNMLIQQENWNKLELLSSECYENGIKGMIYPLVLAKTRLGKLDEAYKLHIQPDENAEYGYLEIVSDLAIMFGNLELAQYCLRQMIAKYPTKDKENNLMKLISLSK